MMDERGDEEIIRELRLELAGTRKHLSDLTALADQQSALLTALEAQLTPPVPVRFVKQAFRHKPDDGIYGDCFRTCVAGLLGLDRDSVPHFVHPEDPWHGREYEWLALRGIGTIRIWYPPEHSLEEILFTSYQTSKHPCILSGKSRNGTSHAVIAYNGMLWHDPSLDDTGIVGPMEYSDGNRWWSLEWFVRHPAFVPGEMHDEAARRGGPMGIFSAESPELPLPDEVRSSDDKGADVPS